MKSNKNFWIFLGSVFILAAFIIYDRYIDDLRVGNITQELPYHPEWEIKALPENEQKTVDQILSQPFTYIGEGGQSYVFASRDNQYVLKLFKFKRFRPAWYMQFIPAWPMFAEYREHHVTSRANKLVRVFTGHLVAYEYIKPESGLVFIQLNPTHVPQIISLKDKVGFTRQVDLGNTVFVLQEKGEMLRLVFSKLLKKGQVDEVKDRIGRIFDMYLSEYSKGIYDDDHGVMQNFGFIGERPFHLDVGKFKHDDSYKQPEIYQPDLIKVAFRMQVWIGKYYPQYYEELIADMEMKLSRILEREFHFTQNYGT